MKEIHVRFARLKMDYDPRGHEKTGRIFEDLRSHFEVIESQRLQIKKEKQEYDVA